jgi:hypothetical protein
MQTPKFETLSLVQLSTATGGAVCQRESMGYVNPPGTCGDFISTAPGYFQAGGAGGAPLTASQRTAVDRARALVR